MCFMERATLTTAAVEEWRPVVGYEGLYEVSNLGRVRSLDRYIDSVNVFGEPYKRFSKGRVLKLLYDDKGYQRITLYNGITDKQKLVHRLVAQAYIPNKDNLPEVNHKDQNPANNCVDNLEWCDRIYNVNYSDARERQWRAVSRPIEQLTMDGQHIAYYLGIKTICRKLNMCRNTIQRCLHGRKRHKSAYGYLWRFADVSKDEVQFATDNSLFQYTKIYSTIEQLTMDGQHVAYFPSMNQAAKAVSCTLQNIHRAVHKRQAAKGYLWRIVENPSKEYTTHT